jgi:gluconolactonase
MTRDNDGNLIVCEHVTSSVVRKSADGRRDLLTYHWRGRYLNSPNDVIVASDGAIVFTDPTYGRMPVFGIERKQKLEFRGVYRLPPDGGPDDLELLLDDFAQPNGLRFSADESVLYVNDTERAHIRVVEVGANHELSNGRVFADDIGEGDPEKGGLADGMKLDARGNVNVAGPGGVWIFSPDGEHLGVIDVPEPTGNLNWGGDDWRSLFISASTSVYRVRMKVGGNRLGCMR